QVRAGTLDALGHRAELLPRLNRARARHHADMPAADRGAVDADDGVRRADLAARELERLEDRHHVLHALQRLERLEAGLEAIVPDRADDGALLPATHVRPETERLDTPTDVLDVGVHDPRLQ